MFCCDCLFRVTKQKSDMVILCLFTEKRAVFSHTLLCRFQFSGAYLGAEKRAIIYLRTRKQISGCAKPHALVLWRNIYCMNLPLLRFWFPEMWRKSLWQHPRFILSPLVFSYQGKGRTWTIVLKVIKGTTQLRMKIQLLSWWCTGKHCCLSAKRS